MREGLTTVSEDYLRPMNPFSYLQNALLLAGMFAVYWLGGGAWGVWLLIFWLSPGGACKCEKDEEDEDAPRIVRP